VADRFQLAIFTMSYKFEGLAVQYSYFNWSKYTEKIINFRKL